MDDLHPDDEPTEEPKKVWGLAAAILAILAVVAVLYYFFFMKKPEPPAAAAPAAETIVPAEGEKTPAGPGGEPLAFPAVSLADSDAVVREFALALSANPEFAKWLLSKD